MLVTWEDSIIFPGAQTKLSREDRTLRDAIGYIRQEALHAPGDLVEVTLYRTLRADEPRLSSRKVRYALVVSTKGSVNYGILSC